MTLREWRRRVAVVAALCAALALVLGGGRAEAYRFLPDPAFGTGGLVNLLAGNGAGGVLREVRGVQPGPEGTVYVLYRELPGPEMHECEAKRYLTRYLPSGALDTSFGSGGVAAVTTPLGCEYPSLAVDGQLRPVLTWTSVGTLSVPSSTLAITRFTSSGAPDPSFGGSGVAFLQIPCPGGNAAGLDSDQDGRLILGFGCRADESPEGLSRSTFQPYLARVRPDGTLDAGFGGGGLLPIALEPGWWSPAISAVEADGSLILSQAVEHQTDAPQPPRLLRVLPDGTLDRGYQARVERSLRRVVRLGAPQTPEEATDFALRPHGGLAVSGADGNGGWVIGLRHDGSLDRGFSQDGYRGFRAPIRFIAADRRGRLFVFGWDYHGLTIYRLQADGNRDRSVGGPRGQQLGAASFTGSLADLVSLTNGRPLLYFKNLGSCSSPQTCAEPAELRRLRLSKR